MQADRVELSWDSQKSNWLVRIEAGEEVVRRHIDMPRDTPEPALRSAAEKIAADEGYEVSAVNIARTASA